MPHVITIVPAPHNRGGRHDHDWYPTGGEERIAGTVAEWSAYCAECGFGLRLQIPRRRRSDPFADAEALANEILGSVGIRAGDEDPRPLSNAERLRDDLYVALTCGGPWPTRLSTMHGALAAMLAAARPRPVPHELQVRAIAEALSRYMECDDTLAGDTCHFCDTWFYRVRCEPAILHQMIADGFAARCPACLASPVARWR